MRRSAPRPLSIALGALESRLAPATGLGAVQRVWPGVAGEALALEAQPTAERDGVLTVSCRSSVWAQELELMGPELAGRLNAALGRDLVRSLRCRATPTRPFT